AVGFAGDNRIYPFGADLVPDFFRVVALVANEVFSGVEFTNNFGGCFNVVNFTPSDFKIDRVSIRITGHVDFGGWSSTGSPNGSLGSSSSSARMLMSADVASVDEYPLLINFAS